MHDSSCLLRSQLTARVKVNDPPIEGMLSVMCSSPPTGPVMVHVAGYSVSTQVEASSLVYVHPMLLPE
jgi:hypothetical protein